jgi:predicted nucleotidyltransferase
LQTGKDTDVRTLNLARVADELVGQLPGLQSLWLFGSRTAGGGITNHDIDLLVQCSGETRPSELRRVALRLSRHLDPFLVVGGTAKSCLDERTVSAESFKALTDKLKAKCFWSSREGEATTDVLLEHRIPRTPAPVRRGRSGRVALVLFCGAIFGALVGLMVGLSMSPVVASVTSGLMGIAVAYATARLGGKRSGGRDSEPTVPSLDSHVYLAGFSALAIGGVLTGVYLRSHATLQPRPKEIFDEWRATGMSSAQAQLVALRVLGVDVAPEELNGGAARSSNSGASAPTTTAAASAPIPASSSPEPADTVQAKASTVAKKQGGSEKPNFRDPGLIKGESDSCDEMVGWANIQKFGLLRQRFTELGGKWADELERIERLDQSQQNQALADFTKKECS